MHHLLFLQICFQYCCTGERTHLKKYNMAKCHDNRLIMQQKWQQILPKILHEIKKKNIIEEFKIIFCLYLCIQLAFFGLSPGLLFTIKHSQLNMFNSFSCHLATKNILLAITERRQQQHFIYLVLITTLLGCTLPQKKKKNTKQTHFLSHHMVP